MHALLNLAAPEKTNILESEIKPRTDKFINNQSNAISGDMKLR
jgi:hypothetical protein